MSDLDELEQRRCDFCETAWDPDLDEPMQPLRIGSIPQPQPVTARGIHDVSNTASWSHSGKAKLEAILNAMRDMDGLEFELHEAVQEVRAVGGEVHFAKVTEEGQMYTESPPVQDLETNYDKTAAELRFHPEARSVAPDAMVCQECAKMFQSLGE